MQIGVLPLGGYDAHETQSVLALKMLYYLQKKNGRYIQHKLNGGEKKIEAGGKVYSVDGFDAETNTIYEIHGCHWHGCPKCFNPQGKLPGKNVSLEQVSNTGNCQPCL